MPSFVKNTEQIATKIFIDVGLINITPFLSTGYFALFGVLILLWISFLGKDKNYELPQNS